MLTAVMRHLEAKAIDDALDLFEILMATRLIKLPARRSTDKQRLSTLPQVKAARIAAGLEEGDHRGAGAHRGGPAAPMSTWPGCGGPGGGRAWAALSSAAATVVSLVPEDNNTAETALRGALALRYNTVRPFLSLLGESKALDAAPGGQTDPRWGAAAPGSLVAVLDATWKQMAERLQEAGSDAKISIEVQPNGRAKLNVEKLHALGEPKSLKWLRERVEKMLPKIDLRTCCSRCTSWTGFLDAFVHLGDGRTRMKDLTTSSSPCW